MQAAFSLFSKAFAEGSSIPKIYTGQGKDHNPPLSWSGVPANTKSFALIFDDPDAPVGNWVHWLIKNIPPTTTEINEKSSVGEEVPNSWGKKKYGGPMPPSGTHRYFFKLYALDIEKMNAKTAEEFYKEAELHKIQMASLMGTYKKQ